MKYTRIKLVSHPDQCTDDSIHKIQELIEAARINFGNTRPNLSDETVQAQFKFIEKWNYTKINFAFLCNNTETITAYNDFMLKINYHIIQYDSIPQL